MDVTTADSQHEDDHLNSGSGSGSGSSAMQHGDEGVAGEGGIDSNNRSDTSTIGSATSANAKEDNAVAAEVDDRLRKMAPLPNIPYQLQV